MGEALVIFLRELARAWLIAKIAERASDHGSSFQEAGCSCASDELDLDSMNDLDDGAPYIWNRTERCPRFE